MIILTIKKANGDVYWVERFKSVAEKDAWLANEQKRPYWRNDFTIEVVDKTADDEAAQEAVDAAIAANKIVRAAAFAKLTALGLTSGELTALFGRELS